MIRILAVDDEGIGISTNGSLTNVKRVKPLEFTFRTDKNDGANSNGHRWNKMTVLCLGDAIKIEEANGD